MAQLSHHCLCFTQPRLNYSKEELKILFTTRGTTYIYGHGGVSRPDKIPMNQPLVFIVNPDFTLGQFSREARAYSVDKTLTGLSPTVKSKKYHVSRYLEDFVLVRDTYTAVFTATDAVATDKARRSV
ncbi:unnamed protein product [Cylicocyclus nassatus]|uniref:Uncharacterized protein n=1 Tax=Cylicocyclus nassatus TaxID=53992 RepID=A0AA36MD91_CYLNA|nr:unnamed protein product [Cylicocyclus nassatus]